MLRLRSLGGLALDAPSVGLRGAATQRRPLALLALLAAAGERGVSRERILLFFWPESSARRARNTLSQTLYTLRRGLGAEDLVVGTSTLCLNPAIFTTDIWDFEAAVSRGDLEAAVALYRGPFLDGFYLPGAPEFER